MLFKYYREKEKLEFKLRQITPGTSVNEVLHELETSLNAHRKRILWNVYDEHSDLEIDQLILKALMQGVSIIVCYILLMRLSLLLLSFNFVSSSSSWSYSFRLRLYLLHKLRLRLRLYLLLHLLPFLFFYDHHQYLLFIRPYHYPPLSCLSHSYRIE